MKTRIRRGLRTALAGSLLFGGLTTVSLAVASALTESAASASTVSLFTSSGTGVQTTVSAVPPDICYVEVTAVGGTGAGSGQGGTGGAGGGRRTLGFR